jgi:MEKHLA domain
MTDKAVWNNPKIVSWTQIILDSYQKIVKNELIIGGSSPIDRAKALYFLPFVVVSHGTQSDPILNYGNEIALNLWEMSWDNFIKTPSRLTAEPMNRQERKEMLEIVNTQGFIDRYRGIRISSQGKRFYIDKAVVWNLVNSENEFCGQAATFSEWRFLS